MDSPISPRFAATIAIALACSTATGQESLRRATIWDLKVGQPISAQPSPDEFRGFACGSNGGAPRQPLTGWKDFARCRAEPDGLHEVYFEYDDELEYIARAKDIDREITRWAGTTEALFPVVVSALFDDGSVLRGVRMLTDSRPDHRDDVTEADLRKRADAYLLGGILASRFNITPARDCMALPLEEGESAIGALYVKQNCELRDAATGRRIVLNVRYFRKKGQSGVNPQLPTQLTEGQFESSTRLEIYQTR
jgi:hypothetical protein